MRNKKKVYYPRIFCYNHFLNLSKQYFRILNKWHFHFVCLYTFMLPHLIISFDKYSLKTFGRSIEISASFKVESQKLLAVFLIPSSISQCSNVPDLPDKVSS